MADHGHGEEADEDRQRQGTQLASRRPGSTGAREKPRLSSKGRRARWRRRYSLIRSTRAVFGKADADPRRAQLEFAAAGGSSVARWRLASVKPSAEAGLTRRGLLAQTDMAVRPRGRRGGVAAGAVAR